MYIGCLPVGRLPSYGATVQGRLETVVIVKEERRGISIEVEGIMVS
jgi:hypothetical protein